KDTKKVIESINAIGNVYKDNERYDLALKTYEEAAKLCASSGIEYKLILIESNIAIIFNCLHKIDSSNYYCYKVLKNPTLDKETNQYFISNVYGVMLSNYIDKEIKDSITKYTDTVIRIKTAVNDLTGLAGNLYNLGAFYNKIKDYKTALKYLMQAGNYKFDNLELLIDIKRSKAIALYNLGNTEEAAELYSKCLELKDTLNQMRSVEALSEMEVKYETGKKEEELKRLGAEKEINDLKAKQSQIWLIVAFGGILFVIIIAVVLFKQNKNRQQANKLLQHQNNEIVHQKKEITDSINYAKRIQLAILPPDKMVKRLLPTAFVMYKPKDVVSGDFYWMEEKNGMVLFAAVDCTGHGVPGAMMSVVGLNLLNQAVKEKGLTTPSEILKHLDTGVTDTLRQSGDTDSIKDGMDLSLCSFNPKTLELQYAGAFNNLWVVRKNISSTYKLQNKFEVFFEEHLLEIKADKFPIGSNLDGVADNYTNHTLQLQKGDCVYLYSDGYADQFGGPKGKKFKYNSLKKFLVTIHELSPNEQREKLFSAFESWRGNLEQIDDILVMGVCV
ncbi:MAG TPA: SpoIIE family protein phosphatase, partial [Bacteroidia bacterium]|nr:SpoIIE family protein phosphatase [Bacteroidia bacterium]